SSALVTVFANLLYKLSLKACTDVADRDHDTSSRVDTIFLAKSDDVSVIPKAAFILADKEDIAAPDFAACFITSSLFVHASTNTSSITSFVIMSGTDLPSLAKPSAISGASFAATPALWSAWKGRTYVIGSSSRLSANPSRVWTSVFF